ICVCVKRVPAVGGTIVLTADGRAVDTSMSGFTVSPHEECAVEEAIQITERLAGEPRRAGPPDGAGDAGPGVTVLTLGPPEAADQLRGMLALGASRAILLRTDGTSEPEGATREPKGAVPLSEERGTSDAGRRHPQERPEASGTSRAPGGGRADTAEWGPVA